MTLTNYVATKDLFQALIRAKRGTRPSSVGSSGMPEREAQVANTAWREPESVLRTFAPARAHRA